MIDNIESKIQNLQKEIEVWRYKRDCLHASIDILFYIMFYIVNTMKKQALLYYAPNQDRKKDPDLNLTPSPLFVATPLYTHCFCDRFIPWNSFFTQQTVSLQLPFVHQVDPCFVNSIDMCSTNKITKIGVFIKKSIEKLYSFFEKVWLGFFQFLIKKLLLSISYL